MKRTITKLTSLLSVFITVVLGGAYFALVGTRASANNHGRGVHFSLTWVGAFSFRPQ